MSRQLLITFRDDKKSRITIPDDAKVTFAPWSPPNKDGFVRNTEQLAGTLRIYQGSKENIVACFSQVESFRDLSLGYAEQVAREEGATIWKDDEKGYVREHKVSVQKQWTDPAHTLEGHVDTGTVGKRGGRRSKKSS